MPRRLRKRFIFGPLLIAAVTYTGVSAYVRNLQEQVPPAFIPVTVPRQTIAVPVPSLAVSTPTPKPTLPATAQVQVAFMSQAPLKVWDAVTQETCEEASLMMVRAYVQGRQLGTPAQQDAEVRALAARVEELGYPVDVTVEELGVIAKGEYGLTPTIVDNPTVEDLKRFIAAGEPVILPAAGKLLENPNFTNGGPKYHMLVLTGYVGDNFVTNDPGTRLGEKFVYPVDRLMNAIHDWNGTAPIEQGAKRVLVLR